MYVHQPDQLFFRVRDCVKDKRVHVCIYKAILIGLKFKSNTNIILFAERGAGR